MRLSDDVITENSIRVTASINEHLYIIASGRCRKNCVVRASEESPSARQRRCSNVAGGVREARSKEGCNRPPRPIQGAQPRSTDASGEWQRLVQLYYYAEYGTFRCGARTRAKAHLCRGVAAKSTGDEVQGGANVVSGVVG
jgi:hypothetical protein